MNAAKLVDRAASLGVSLRLDGSQIKIRGPRDARDAILPEVLAYKREIAAYLGRHPVADGQYTPYALPSSSENVNRLVADLRSTIDKLADIERWSDRHRTEFQQAVARQPASTRADDLAHFRGLLCRALAKKCAVELCSRACTEASRPREDAADHGRQPNSTQHIGAR